jgi:hypothetical protein
VPLLVEEFAGSIARLEWAKDNGCPWQPRTCSQAAHGGRLEVLRWAREHGCDWDAGTCATADAGGHLEVLRWARELGCPWEEDIGDHPHLGCLDCCALAAAGGHLKVLTCGSTAAHGMRIMRATYVIVVCSPLRAGTWRYCGGFGSTTARGMRRRVRSLHRAGTWRC